LARVRLERNLTQAQLAFDPGFEETASGMMGAPKKRGSRAGWTSMEGHVTCDDCGFREENANSGAPSIMAARR
jgi:hypothetical protein